MLIANRFADPDDQVTDTLALPYEARLRSRRHLRLATGEAFGYNLPPGIVLRHGDKLLAEDGHTTRVVEIVAAVESLVEVRVSDALQLARAAYHLGNRHVTVGIGQDEQGHYLLLQPDHVLEDMLVQLGCVLRRKKGPFQPEGGAYGGHGHSHAPKIHEFRE
jgi:urease accessory protein